MSEDRLIVDIGFAEFYFRFFFAGRKGETY